MDVLAFLDNIFGDAETHAILRDDAVPTESPEIEAQLAALKRYAFEMADKTDQHEQ